MYREMNGYKELSKTDKIDFEKIFRRFYAAQGRDAQENTKVIKITKCVSNADGMHQFRIDIMRYGKIGYQYLDPVKMEWY